MANELYTNFSKQKYLLTFGHHLQNRENSDRLHHAGNVWITFHFGPDSQFL